MNLSFTSSETSARLPKAQPHLSDFVQDSVIRVRRNRITPDLEPNLHINPTGPTPLRFGINSVRLTEPDSGHLGPCWFRS
jgi:hypothetical protein